MAALTPEQLKLAQDNLKAIEEGTKQLRNLNAEEQNHLEILIKLNSEHQKSSEYLKNQEEILKQQQKIVQSMEDSATKKIQLDKIDLDLQETILEQARKKTLEGAKGRDLSADELENYKKHLEELEKIQEKRKDMARAEGAADTLLGFLGISENNKSSLTYQLLKNPEQIFSNVSSKLTNMGGTASSIGLSLLMKVQEATVQAFYANDKAISGFVAATGASSAYNDIIVATARGNTALGVSFEEAGKAVTDLYTNLNTFTTLSKSAQAELTVTTAKLEKLGISGGETANSIATLSEMMRVSEVQAAKVVEEFAAMGQAIGVSSKQMISDFVGVKDQLAVFGNDMNKVFTDLAAESKATGVAVGDLLNLANKFDTFSSAADSVGKLNAILNGPYLSTMAMIEATDPTERIDMLRQAVNNAGIAFDEMSYYEKKAIMEAGGFKTVEEAQRVLSMSAGAYADQLKNQTATQEELNNAVERAQSINDKLSLIMANFAIVMEPVVTFTSAFLSVILEILDAAPILKYVLGGILIVLTGMFVVTKLHSLFSAFGSALSALGLLAAPVGPTLLAASEGAALAGTTLAAASPAIVEGSAALGTLALVLLAVGAAVVLVGFGLKLMFEGIASVIKEGVKVPEVFLNMAAGLLALSAALLVFSNAARVGMANIITSVYGLALAINSVESDKVLNFKVMMEKIVEISEPDTAAQFAQFKEDFEAVAKATADLNVTNMKTFSTMLTATQNLSQNLQLKQDIKVFVDSQAIAARIEKRQGNAAVQGV